MAIFSFWAPAGHVISCDYLQCCDGGDALLSIYICFVSSVRCKKLHCEVKQYPTREGLFVRVYIFPVFICMFVIFLSELSQICQPANICNSQMIKVKTWRDKCFIKTLVLPPVRPQQPQVWFFFSLCEKHLFFHCSTSGASSRRASLLVSFTLLW